jgi:hypothetical protein
MLDKYLHDKYNSYCAMHHETATSYCFHTTIF